MPVAPIASSHQLKALRIGSVSFLNAAPLNYGLDEDDDLELKLEVPSRLLNGMLDRSLDVALLPVIDYQRMLGLKLLAAGGIGSDGPTLTVRILSRVPIDRIDALACDPDSHTSVALARIILSEVYHVRPEFMPLRSDAIDATAACLLIGDKVVCQERAGFAHQLDLGDAWKRHTGLPFVFAAWMARGDVELGDLPARLVRAKGRGREHIEQIIVQHALPRGWPPQVARDYLTRHLRYEIGPAELKAMRLFHELAFTHGLLPHRPRDLECVS